MAENTKRRGSGDGDLGRSEVDEKLDAINAQGFMGEKVDPTPNENYSVEGVTSGKPTPETDEKARAKAQANARAIGGPERGEGDK